MIGHNANRFVILDVDGVLWIDGAPGLGAVRFLDLLSVNGIQYRLLTNTCTMCKSDLVKSLRNAGFSLGDNEVFTAAQLTGEWLRKESIDSIMYLGAPGALPDIPAGISVCDNETANAVVIGDLFDYYQRSELEAAVNAVRNGAKLVAMQRNTRWSDGNRWFVDNGFWVAGLEYVTGCKAITIGKPSLQAFLSTVSSFESRPSTMSDIMFVSDDVESDLRGAKEAGLTTVHFGSDALGCDWIDYSARDMSSLETLLLG